LTLDQNKLFAQLAAADQSALRALSEPVDLSASQVLGAPHLPTRHVHFPTGATVAMVVGDATKPRLAVSLVGQEGAVGLHAALGLEPGVFTFLVQTPGPAWCVDAVALRDLIEERPAVLLALSRYIWSLAQEVAVCAAFAQSSEVKPRLARWILNSFKGSTRRELNLTHLHLAQMLGVRRSSITLAAIELKADGLIGYSRGKLTLLDARGLEAAASSASLF
jgi:CRP-like cAMP-binding protein